MLNRHDAVPHFTLKTIAGDAVAYSTIWQREHLVLIALRERDTKEAAEYIARMTEALSQVRDDTALVITRNDVEGLPAPAVLVADRWGEVAHVFRADDVTALPKAEDVLEWIEHVRQRCPECEGETR
jgi:peroxiredoxin